MRWSFHLGRLAGIPLRVHYTFLLLLAWIVFRAFGAGASPLGAMLDTAFVLAVFGSVVLHELGHALTARRFGVRTRDIMLLPIGGVASLEHMPRSSREELWIAIAGPLVNLAIAAATFLLLSLFGGVLGGEVGALAQSFLSSLMWANLGLAIFNLIPAFPMDGGRVLRAMLARRRGYLRATLTAAGIGRVFAIGFGILGLFTNPMLLLVAVFLWAVGRREAAAARWQATAAKGSVWSPFASFDQEAQPGSDPGAPTTGVPPRAVIWVVERR